jgi:hypothetical protein
VNQRGLVESEIHLILNTVRGVDYGFDDGVTEFYRRAR